MGQVNPPGTEGKHQSGQTAQNEIGFVIPFIEWMAPYKDNGSGVLVTGFEDDEDYDITPVDDQFAKVRLTDITAIATILAEIAVAVPTTIQRIDFPDTLTGVTAVFNKATGTGTDSHPAAQQDFEIFGTGSGSLTPSSTSQGSASVMPDVQPAITTRYHTNVPAMEYTFYMPSGTTQAQILTRLTALAGAGVASWPSFKPQYVVLTLKGQQVSVSAKASTNVSGGGSASNGQSGFQWGNGTSEETGVNITTKIIPPTIHAAITISGPTDSGTATASADASTPIFAPGTPGTQPAITNTATVSLNADGSITPSTITATAAPTSIPGSGLYVFSLSPGPLTYGEVIFQAVVVNFATL